VPLTEDELLEIYQRTQDWCANEAPEWYVSLEREKPRRIGGMKPRADIKRDPEVNGISQASLPCPQSFYLDAPTLAMYPKWPVFVLTLLSCLFLMASAAPISGGDVAPAKRLKQFQIRRSSSGGGIVARE
jgi:hypothetical protein